MERTAERRLAEKRRVNGQNRASKALQKFIAAGLTDEALRDACRANAEDVIRLRQLSSKPGRHSATQLRALELQLAYGHGRPKGAEGDAGEKAMDVTLVRVVNQVLSLPPEVLRAYLDTGKLPPGSWLPGYQAEQGEPAATDNSGKPRKELQDR